jgi:ubiquinone/menaquinone biosynthesis C-methylase UbiE
MGAGIQSNITIQLAGVSTPGSGKSWRQCTFSRKSHYQPHTTGDGRLMSVEQMPPLFFEIHNDLPREGPGDHKSTMKALSMLHELQDNPYILDVGCGPGMQTIDILDFTNGTIVAVDNHQPFLDQLSERVLQRAMGDRIQIVNADMTSMDFPPTTFDLIWSEGAAYIMGFENALNTWKVFLKKQGYLAVTELTWIRSSPPEDVRRYFDKWYPAMKNIESNLDVIRHVGYSVVGHFTLPKSSWWDHYYIPIEEKLPGFREKYKGNPEALAMADLHEMEIDMYRKYSDFYGYVFYMMKNI